MQSTRLRFQPKRPRHASKLALSNEGASKQNTTAGRTWGALTFELSRFPAIGGSRASEPRALSRAPRLARSCAHSRSIQTRHWPAFSSGVPPERPARKKPRREAEAKCLIHRLLCSRDDRIRTCDPLNPIQVRYRAAPHPVAVNNPADRLKNLIPCPASNQCLPTSFRGTERRAVDPRSLGGPTPCPPLLSTA